MAECGTAVDSVTEDGMAESHDKQVIDTTAELDNALKMRGAVKLLCSNFSFKKHIMVK